MIERFLPSIERICEPALAVKQAHRLSRFPEIVEPSVEPGPVDSFYSDAVAIEIADPDSSQAVSMLREYVEGRAGKDDDVSFELRATLARQCLSALQINQELSDIAARARALRTRSEQPE